MPTQSVMSCSHATTYEEVDILREETRAPVLVTKGTRPGEVQDAAKAPAKEDEEVS